MGRNHWKQRITRLTRPNIPEQVAPLTWGGIIGNPPAPPVSILRESRGFCRPINLGRNHWKPGHHVLFFTGLEPRRPINLGRNHWKLFPNLYLRGSFRKVSRPINLGRNHWKRSGVVTLSGSSRFSCGRPINLGRNHWKLALMIMNC